MSREIPVPTPAIGGGFFCILSEFDLFYRRVYLVILGIRMAVLLFAKAITYLTNPDVFLILEKPIFNSYRNKFQVL